MNLDGLMYIYSGESLYKAVEWNSESMSFLYEPTNYFEDTAPPFGPMVVRFDNADLNTLPAVEFPTFAPVDLYPSADTEFFTTDLILWDPISEHNSQTYIELEFESLAGHDEFGFPIINYLTCAVEDDGTYQLPREAIEYLGVDNPVKMGSIGRFGNIDISSGHDIVSVFTRTKLTAATTWPCSTNSQLCN